MNPPPLDKNQLIEYLASGCKQPQDWRIGTESEKLLLSSSSLQRFPYEGKASIQAVFKALQNFGWEPVYEQDFIIALQKPTQKSSITLEPGGQFELSGAPVKTLHDTKLEVDIHLKQIKEIVTDLGGVILAMGCDPLWPRDDIPWMPKGRYELMRQYMPTRGNLGLDMMTRTCTVQVNLDFQSEADMVAKMRIGMALQPLVCALFASSPFLEGKLTEYQSYRAHIWQDTDPDRCGILPFVFEDGMGFERYVDYLLDVPMYFVYRGGKYINALGQSFRDFMIGKLPALPGEHAVLQDWVDQTTIAFPEVRLKQFLEMRGADCGTKDMVLALPAFWVGLLYDSTAQDEALQLIQDWSINELLTAYANVPRNGLNTMLNNRTLHAIARDVMNISQRGLKRRANLHNGYDETEYLNPLIEIAESGRTVAIKLIESYQETRDIQAVIRRYIESSQI
jgi:glutamate--cysteine ligase